MMIPLLINIIGFCLIGFIAWWFIISSKKSVKTKSNLIDIKVHEGIYEPSVITAKKGQPLQLRFYREDTTPCSEVVIFEQLKLNATLPIKKHHTVTLTVNEPGSYDFTCQMGMYRGKLIIE